MDELTIVINVLLGALIAQGGAWLNRTWGKKDRAVDRDEARKDKHRDDLRRAYAEFLAAANHMIDRGYTMAGISSAVDNIKEEGDVPAPELIARSRASVEEFIAARTSAEEKGFAVSLLEPNLELRVMIHNIALDKLQMPGSDGDEKRFETDLDQRRERVKPVASEPDRFATSCMRGCSGRNRAIHQRVRSRRRSATR